MKNSACVCFNAPALQSFQSAYIHYEFFDSHFIIQRTELRKVADVGLVLQRIVNKAAVIEQNMAFRSAAAACYDIQKRCFPCSVYPKQTHDLPGGDFKGNMVQSGKCAIFFSEIFNDQNTNPSPKILYIKRCWEM